MIELVSSIMGSQLPGFCSRLTMISKRPSGPTSMSPVSIWPVGHISPSAS